MHAWVTFIAPLIILLILVALLLSLHLLGRGAGSTAILAAGLTFVGAVLGYVAQYGLAQLQEASAPPDKIEVFIEDIDFGLPSLPASYKDGATDQQIADDLRALRDAGHVIVVSDTAAHQINDAAVKSAQGDWVVANRGYETKEIAAFLDDAMKSYTRLRSWGPRVSRWGEDLGRAEAGVDDVMWQFVSGSLKSEVDNSGVMGMIVGMADGGAVKMDQLEGDCSSKEVKGFVREHRQATRVRVEFTEWILNIAGGEEADSERTKLAVALAHLIEHSCVRTLSGLFKAAGDRAKTSAAALESYVKAWSDVLTGWKSDTLGVSVTFSNRGKFDSFLRSSGKIAVGSRGDTDHAIQVAIVAVNNERAPVSEPYISIRSREARTQMFAAHLSADERDRLHGTFTGGLTYLRAAFLASAGDAERVVLSRTAPFSTEARERALASLKNAAVPVE